MFTQAKPIWEIGTHHTMNRHLLFYADVDSLLQCKIKLATSGFYRLSVNHSFVSFGPARGPEGYARVDELDLSAFDCPHHNHIIIECVGYCCRTISTVLSSNYLVAELSKENEILLATGSDNDFVCSIDEEKEEKTARFSFQRHFTEVINSRRMQGNIVKTELIPGQDIRYLPRVAPYPDFSTHYLPSTSAFGHLEYRANLPSVVARYSNPIHTFWGRYSDSEIPFHPAFWLQKQKQIHVGSQKTLPITLSPGEYAVFDFAEVENGFPVWDICAQEESDVIIAYSETNIPNAYIKAYGERNPIDGNPDLSPDTDFSLPASNLLPVIEHLIPQDYHKETTAFEPCSFRYLLVAVKSGTIILHQAGVRHYQNPMNGLQPIHIQDKELAKIYQASVRTFAHNAVDLYMDCPSRERAGWLCDSYFTAKTEYWLLGQSQVEDAFLENYRLYTPQEGYPEGVLPMCYPSDCHEIVKYIPQWDMWYILEVCDYLTNRRPDLDKKAFKDSIYGFIAFMESYKNANGLYEDLPSWNFVEWSHAQDWAKDVSFPTNFLYAAVLDETGKMYHDTDLCHRAHEIREVALRLSFDGELFRDHLIKEKDGYIRPQHISEACQYYAVLFSDLDITDEKYAYLRNQIKEGFRSFNRPDFDFVPVNAFIGFYLRLLTLMQLKDRKTLCNDIKEFFLPMVRESNTLWEYRDGHGSRDHGFASFAAVAIGFATNSKQT